jgi:hypothetical protein
MWRHLRGPLCLAGAVLTLAACTEPQSDPPGAFQGTYVLQSVDGKPIPILMPSTAPFSMTLVADTFVFDVSGHYTRRLVESIDDSLTGSHHVNSTLDSGVYVAKDDTIEFPHPCIVNGVCVIQPFGVLEPSGDLLFVDSVNPFRDWLYRFVR